MAFMNTGDWKERVLLKYYIPLRSTPFFFLFNIFHYFFPSIPEWVYLKGLKHSSSIQVSMSNYGFERCRFLQPCVFVNKQWLAARNRYFKGKM